MIGLEYGGAGTSFPSSVALFLFKLFFKISRFVGLCGAAAGGATGAGG